MPSDFDRIGGEPVLRAIVDRFVDRCFDDVMIGFHFRRASRDRVKRFEYEHAAEHLGAGVAYGGRPIREAHGPHAIFGGHFERRLVILREALDVHGVPEDVRERWLDVQRALRGEVTADVASECDEGRALDRAEAFRVAQRTNEPASTAPHTTAPRTTAPHTTAPRTTAPRTADPETNEGDER